MDAGAGGSVRVALLDPEGEPIPGCTLEESQVLRGNSFRCLVTWRKGPDLSGLHERISNAGKMEANVLDSSLQEEAERQMGADYANGYETVFCGSLKDSCRKQDRQGPSYWRPCPSTVNRINEFAIPSQVL